MRPQRKRLLAFVGLAALPVLILCAVLWAGWALTDRYIETGVGDYRGIEKRYANTAVELARVQTSEWGGSTFPVAAYRVTDIRRCPGRPLRCGPDIRVRKGVYRDNPACEGSPFAVDVETHTLFGIPSGDADLPCDS